MKVVTYTIDFFPDEPGTYLQQLRFLGPSEGTIVETRVLMDFTTAQGFRAEDLFVELFVPVDNATFGYWGTLGADLGWGGPGTWSAAVTTHDLDGPLMPRLWALHIWSINDPPDYTGSFSMATRIEIDIDVPPQCGSPDFDGDGDVGTDADIEAFFACLAGTCCTTCGSADFNDDGDVGTDADIEAFFRVLAGGTC
jgi:hypothetical protein